VTTTLVYAIKYVADTGAAVRFHRDQLGLKLRFESPHWSEFETGSTTLALHPATGDRPSGRGIDFISPPTALRGHKLAKFKDSEGAQTSLSG
jgi:lactoylglutathione lyase